MQSHEMTGRYLIRNKATGMWLNMTPKTEEETKAFFASRITEGAETSFEVWHLAPRRVFVETKIVIC